MGFLVFLFLLFIAVSVYLIYKSCQDSKKYNGGRKNNSYYFDDEELDDYDSFDEDFNRSFYRNSNKSDNSYSGCHDVYQNGFHDFDPYNQDPSKSMYLGEAGDILEDL